MRRLLPGPLTEDPDLEAAYDVPGPGLHVRANMVAGVDGAVSVDGRSGGLSTPGDRRVFAVLRGLADVVLVGAGTVRVEGYGPARPTAERRERRIAAGLAPTPTIAVVSGRIDLDLGSELFEAAEARTILVTTGAAPRERLATAERVADVVVAGQDAVDVTAALAALADRGLRRVLCEGGPSLLGAVAAADALDELCLTVSPRLTGGGAGRITSGPPLTASLGLAHVLEEDGALFLRYTRTPRAHR